MKLIKKLFPVNIYDIAATESYLRDMAANGFLCKKLGTFAHYEKTEPQNITYRLEPLMENEGKPQADKIAYYKDCGWDYICTLQPFRLYSSIEKTPTEIHSDPITQGYAYEYLHKKLKFSFLFAFPLMLLSLAMTLYSMLGHPQPVLYHIEYGIVEKLMMIVVILYSTYFSAQHSIRIKLLLTKLQSGTPMRHKKKYRKTYTQYVFLVIALVFFLRTSVNLAMYDSIHWGADLSEYQGTVPTVPLSQIEKDESLEYEKYDEEWRRGEQTSRWISHDSTDLAPKMYEIYEDGIIERQNQDGTEDNYTPSIRTYYYELRFDFLAEPLLRDLIDDAWEFNRYEEIIFEELLETPFDNAITIKLEGSQLLFANVSNRVVFITYYGEENLFLHHSEIFDNLVAH